MTVRLVSASDLAEGRTVVDDRLVESPPGGHSETYSGNHLRDRYDDGQRPAQRCDADVISKRVTDETCQEGPDAPMMAAAERKIADAVARSSVGTSS